MTRLEFDRWWAGYCAVFPETAAWINNLRQDARQAEAKEAVKAAWAYAMRDVELQDAEAVTRMMVSGEMPAVKPYERESTAAMVRTAARQVKIRRQSAALPKPQGEPVEYSRKCDSMPLGKMLVEARKMKASGATEGEIHERMLAMIPPGDPQDGPRFHCGICQDTGHITVWSKEAIDAAVANEQLPKPYRREVSIRCLCPRGRIVDTQVFYDAERYCRIINGDVTSDTALRDFSDWIETCLSAKRVSTFDEYNNAP